MSITISAEHLQALIELINRNQHTMSAAERLFVGMVINSANAQVQEQKEEISDDATSRQIPEAG